MDDFRSVSTLVYGLLETYKFESLAVVFGAETTDGRLQRKRDADLERGALCRVHQVTVVRVFAPRLRWRWGSGLAQAQEEVEKRCEDGHHRARSDREEDRKSFVGWKSMDCRQTAGRIRNRLALRRAGDRLGPCQSQSGQAERGNR